MTSSNAETDSKPIVIILFVYFCAQVAGLSGIQNLASLVELNVAGTPLVTDALLCLRDLPQLRALNIAATANVNGDMALQYMAGTAGSFCVAW